MTHIYIFWYCLEPFFNRFWFFSVVHLETVLFGKMYECCSAPTQLFLDAIASPSSYDGAITTQASMFLFSELQRKHMTFLFSESQWRSPFVVQISKTIWHSRFQNCNGGRPPSSSCFSLTTMQWTGALTSFGKFLFLFPPLFFAQQTRVNRWPCHSQ